MGQGLDIIQNCTDFGELLRNDIGKRMGWYLFFHVAFPLGYGIFGHRLAVEILVGGPEAGLLLAQGAWKEKYRLFTQIIEIKRFYRFRVPSNKIHFQPKNSPLQDQLAFRGENSLIFKFIQKPGAIFFLFPFAAGYIAGL